jgi:hypothetical protein
VRTKEAEGTCANATALKTAADASLTAAEAKKLALPAKERANRAANCGRAAANTFEQCVDQKSSYLELIAMSMKLRTLAHGEWRSLCVGS